MKRKSRVLEHLDGPLDPVVLAGNLRDLARLNHWLGGSGLSWRATRPLLPDLGGRSVRLLDIGTGAADIPRALTDRAAQAGIDLEAVAVDVRPEIVAYAAAAVRDVPAVQVRLGARDRIDAPDRSFDIVHSSLVLHHHEPEAAVTLLREMGRVASRAVIVNDLDRGDHWYLVARLLARFTTTNPYTRHDGPLSVERAYRPREIVELARRAGLVEECRHWTRPRFRYAITFGPANADGSA